MRGLHTPNLPEKIVDAIAKVVGDPPVALHEPHFSCKESDYLEECLTSTFVSSVGSYVDRFEAELANYTGAKYAIALVNGTSALHISLKLADVGLGDEVLIPALTFIATANAVSYCGAIPILIDADPKTLGVDPAALREYLNENSVIRDKHCINKLTGNHIKAIIPMHTFGHPVKMDELISVASDYHLTIIEDAAESLGSYYCGKHTGTFGLLGTLSFNGNKTITTGGGGAILTNNKNLAKRAKHLTTTAKLPHRWEYIHDEVGYNYRMPNINAALGCAQLEQVDKFIKNKRNLYSKYQSAFANLNGVSIFSEPEDCMSNYWLQTLILTNEDKILRDEILSLTNNKGYMTRPVWSLLHKLEPYKNCQHMELSVAESLSSRLINLPSNV